MRWLREDAALVGLVFGGTTSFVLALVTLGLGAWLGRVPPLLMVLLGTAVSVSAGCLILLLTGRRS